MLDATFIVTRRRQLRTSQRDLARSTGVSLSIVRAIEEGTANGETLTLASLTRLARSLAVHVPRLFLADAADAEPEPADPLRDAATLGSLLLEERGLIPQSAIAAALGWDRPRVVAAAARLEATLLPCGMVLHRLKDGLALRASATLDEEPRKRLAHARVAARGLKGNEARFLRRILAGDMTERDLVARNTRLVAVPLERAGLYARVQEAPNMVVRLLPTPDLLFSLGLKDRSEKPMKTRAPSQGHRQRGPDARPSCRS